MRNLRDIELTRDQQETIACCINTFGSGEHPWADETTIGDFATVYALKCLVTYFVDGHRTDGRDNEVLSALDTIKNATKEKRA